MAVEVVQYREDVPTGRVLHELMDGADLAIKFDCASRKVTFVVEGWFVFPHGSLQKFNLNEPA